ncbi:MAG: aldo/keto reductase [Verrucomicrobiae bacterium]|nr:aldo/keto reductase [Verrucomicrobiae bacterium]
MKVERRPLGDTGFEVSSIGLGCVTFGREIDALTSFGILDHARASGINLLDTAAAYHAGASERVIGEWLAERGCQDEFFIATKAHLPLTRDALRQSVEESRGRLRVDAIDLFQCHAWDDATPVEETLTALGELIGEGKIRQAGCSNWTAVQLARARELSANDSALAKINSIQPPYNLVQREIETETLPLCEREKVGVLTYSPLAAGFLTGKYRRDGVVPSGTRFDVIPGHQPIYFTERGWGISEGLAAIAEREGRSPVALALGWVLSRPGVTSMLVGARKTGHIDQALAAMREPLSQGLLAELNRLSEVDSRG